MSPVAWGVIIFIALNVLLLTVFHKSRENDRRNGRG
jgi:hypothetical protein